VFLDSRNPALVQHPVEQMLAQRIYGLALGYEDLNDHEQLRQDPLLKLLAGKPDLNQPLAGKSTLNRMELGDGLPNQYTKITFWRDAIDELLIDVFLEAQATQPEQIVLDIDTTDLAIHGGQEGASITATTLPTAICRCTFLRESMYYALDCGPAISIPQREVARNSSVW
jgi:hypothetical protein